MELKPIGKIEGHKYPFKVKINEEYRSALLGLNGFSHCIILWWADKCDNPEARNLSRSLFLWPSPLCRELPIFDFIFTLGYSSFSASLTAPATLSAGSIPMSFTPCVLRLITETPFMGIRIIFPMSVMSIKSSSSSTSKIATT